MVNGVDKIIVFGDSMVNINLEEIFFIFLEDLVIIKGIFSIDSFFVMEIIVY